MNDTRPSKLTSTLSRSSFLRTIDVISTVVLNAQWSMWNLWMRRRRQHENTSHGVALRTRTCITCRFVALRTRKRLGEPLRPIGRLVIFCVLPQQLKQVQTHVEIEIGTLLYNTALHDMNDRERCGVGVCYIRAYYDCQVRIHDEIEIRKSHAADENYIQHLRH